MGFIKCFLCLQEGPLLDFFYDWGNREITAGKLLMLTTMLLPVMKRSSMPSIWTSSTCR